jgi:hypothetical protein
MRLNFGQAIHRDEAKRLKVGSQIREESTGDIWTLSEPPIWDKTTLSKHGFDEVKFVVKKQNTISVLPADFSSPEHVKYLKKMDKKFGIDLPTETPWVNKKYTIIKR